LELGVLVGGGDVGIAEQMSHGRTVAEPCNRPCLVLLLTVPGTAPTTSTADLPVNAEVMQPPIETSKLVNNFCPSHALLPTGQGV
jgi:hypothetical protein